MDPRPAWSSPSVAWTTALVTGAMLTCIHAIGWAQTPPVPTAIKAEPAPDWDTKFSGKEGWVGGDGAYSVVLKRRKILWLFGDTLLGTVRDGKRAGAIMVNNTVGLQSGQDGEAAIRFVAGRAKDGKPTAVFLPADGKGWLWPQAAVQVGDRLFVFLAQIDRGDRPGVLGFQHIGLWLGIITNPDDEPLSWKMKQHKVPFARFDKSSVRSWGSAVLVDGEYLYIYGYLEQGKEIGTRKLLLARVPTDRPAELASWRFRTLGGWSEKAEDATPLASGIATECSVSRMPDGKGYILVYTENGLGERIVGRFARAPEGPWSAPLLLFCCPEMASDRGVFCYAAKAHPWAGKGDELLISYCVNAWDFGRLFREEKVYRPRLVRVKLRARK